MGEQSYPLGERNFAVALSLVAGFVDTAGFVALFGLFTAHVTGNFVLAGAALAGSQAASALAPLAVAPIFMVAVAGAALVARRARRGGGSPLRLLLALEAVWLVLFLAAGVAAAELLRPDAPMWTLLVGAFGVVAMAIQNTLMREAAPKLPASTVMTGNFTQFTMDLVHLSSAEGRGDAETRARMARIGPALVAFVVGAGLGAYGMARLGFWCMALPALIVALLALAGPRRP